MAVWGSTRTASRSPGLWCACVPHPRSRRLYDNSDRPESIDYFVMVITSAEAIVRHLAPHKIDLRCGPSQAAWWCLATRMSYSDGDAKDSPCPSLNCRGADLCRI